MKYLPWIAGGAALGLAARRGRRGRRAVDSRATEEDYGGQEWLYHWTTPAKLPFIRQHGLRPGKGEALGNTGTPSIRQHSQKGVFFSTDSTKWQPESGVLLRVALRDVRCIYDGGEWNSGVGWVDGRLADCFTAAIAPHLIQIQQGPHGPIIHIPKWVWLAQ